VNLAFNYELTIIPVMNVEVTIAYVIHRVLTDVDSKEPLPLNDSSNRHLS
jgi:hypothetical protein